MNWKELSIQIGKGLLAVLCACILFFVSLFCSVVISFITPSRNVYIVLLFIVAVVIELVIIGVLWKFIKKKFFYIPLCVVLLMCGAVCVRQVHIDRMPPVAEGENLLASYAPFAPDSKVVTLEEESALAITEEFPKMDGATALYPIYAGFAKAVYPKSILEEVVEQEDSVLTCTTTNQAYNKIVTGEADVIFVAGPSTTQELFAEGQNVELIYTPIGKEAFVFFVNAKNPIEDISVEQIQDIYSGETTQWSKLGVRGLGNIRAFQRDEGSGSQSALVRLMNGKQLMTPPKEDVISGMGGIIQQTADYKNFKNAIGFSFRFYATEMVQNEQIKLLKVDGVEPNRENIENGSYPLASNFYAVTRTDMTENTQKLLDWILSAQGQKIIEETGYTPIN